MGQYDEELAKLKKERRPGRPSSTREDLLRIKIATDEKEYEIGFCMPPLLNADFLHVDYIRPTRPE